MAQPPTKKTLENAPKANEPDLKALSGEAKQRLDACRRQKAEFDLDIREAYFFAAPHRAREIRSEQAPSQTKPQDAGEQQTGIASELARDFVTEIVNAFMPQAEPWAERRPGMFLPEKVAADVKKMVAAQDPVIFNAIRASNFYEVLPMAFNPDLAVGTAAVWIDDLRPSENFVTQPIPLRELEINVGPFGGIDDRFVVRHTKNRHVEAVLSGITLPAECKRAIDAKPDELTEIRWGFWRLWHRTDDVVWQHVVMVKDEVIHSAEIKGAGCCPLIPMRFNAYVEWAHGAGPLIEGLADLRLLDAMEGDKLDAIELKLKPPMGFPDDTFAAVEEGIETGSAYPIRPGSEGAAKAIHDGGDLNPAMYETAMIEDRLRRRFFLNFPEQRGKTPPTLGQWLDEMARAQRQIGTPGMAFWREGPAEIFLRFKYLLEARGIIDPITVNGKAVSLEPYNPAQRAAEQQEVMMAARFLEIAGPTWPEEFRVIIDGEKTMQAIATKMRASLVVFREKKAQKDALALVSRLIEGRQRVSPPDASVAAGQ